MPDFHSGLKATALVNRSFHQTFIMVKTNSKAKTKTPVKPEITEDTTQFDSEDLDFEIDPELLEPGQNQVRRPNLPYVIVINEQVAGILIP